MGVVCSQRTAPGRQRLLETRAGCQIVALIPANQREIKQNGSSVGVIVAQNLTSDFYRLLHKRAGARVVPLVG